jgi:hypothetical protein
MSPRPKYLLKAQNIYIKLFLKLKNTYNKPCFETAYLGENVKIAQSGHPEWNTG